MRELLLASASPRRAALLEQIGVPFRRLAPPEIDETPAPGEAPDDYVQRMAREKALRGWAPGGREEANRFAVLGADTTVTIDGAILGKPRDLEDAREMLWRLAGREQQVLSAVSVVTDQWQETRLGEARVRMRPDMGEHIEAYLATGEPFGKAGAWAIQGFGEVLVEHLAGSYSAVVGLPLAQTQPLLARAGVPWWQSPGSG